MPSTRLAMAHPILFLKFFILKYDLVLRDWRSTVIDQQEARK
jgi:hypothetical protein